LTAPSLEELGRDLLIVPRWQVAFTLAAPFALSVIEGVTLQQRLWLFAMRRPGKHRSWALAESAISTSFFIAAVTVWPLTKAPLAYAALMIAGSWIFPVATAYIPHDAGGTTTLTQTKLFRGRVLALLAMEHLYHLEHHLYPAVPHHNWPKLASRLDPYFQSEGLRPIRLWF
jgi:beta-carotene hydroxylase